MVYVDQNGQKSIFIAPGANALLKPKDLDSLAHKFASRKIILTQLESLIKKLLHAAQVAQKTTNYLC